MDKTQKTAQRLRKGGTCSEKEEWTWVQVSENQRKVLKVSEVLTALGCTI